MPFTTTTAIEYAQSGQIETWIQAYLQIANPAFAQGLRQQQRWWVGPRRVNSSDLTRTCGPEPLMKYKVDPEQWEQRISGLMHSLTDPLTIPPLIVEYRSGSLIIHDGNHRHEAMRRKNWLTCWVVIWHNSEEEFRSDPYAASV